MSASNVALGVLDIVHNVTDHLGSHARHDSKQVLWRLVQVNRLFHDVALPKLWREMQSLDPLFNLIPPVGFSRIQTQGTNSADVFSRFRGHALLIRSLDLSSEDTLTCIPRRELLQHIGQPLLPFPFQAVI
ncbi:hypothetical protein C8Q80DRAFT_499554 [Daedaleopsis nitida]|nr:hypothetical protein C8Q80DRAFT_499554 [Daedaleopsis nitida]